jgi:hypothetical protein
MQRAENENHSLITRCASERRKASEQEKLSIIFLLSERGAMAF